MADMYITGEPAGNWETAVGNSAYTEYEVDVTGINDMELLEQYMHDNVGAIPYELVNGQKIYIRFAKLPQNNTSVTIQGIVGLVEGTAGYLTGYTGEGFWLRLAKGTVLNAIIRSMYIGIGANEVAQSVIGDLDSRLDDFCIVGSDDVPVYVDGNGVSYVLEDAVEAVRAGLISLGAYDDTRETTPGTYTYSGRITGTITVPSETEEWDDVALSQAPFSYLSSGSQRTIQHVWVNKQGGTSIDIVDRTYMFIRNTGTRPALTIIADVTDLVQQGLIDTGNTNGYVARGIKDGEEDKILSSGTFTGAVINVTKNGLTKSINLMALSTNLQTSDYPSYANFPVVGYQYYGAALFTFGKAGEGVEGMTVADSIPMGFGDATLPLGDVVPGWALRGKDVSMPDEDNIWAKNPVLPLDVPLDDVWADGYAGDSADTYDGDLADILKDALVDVLPDILDDIIENTDVTEADVYDIPAGDSGNTPPAEPPVLNGSSNGLWTMYNPTKQQVNDFGAWLWSDTLIDQIIRQFNSPIDAVIGFHQIYCTPITGSAKIIKAGFLDSPVSAAEVTNQYATIDCGQVSVDEYYQNALDYDNTQVSLFLPFVGIVPLNTNVVMGSVLHVIYRIDVFTGTCLAQVKVIKANSNAVMYAFEGNCAVQIPLTGTTYTGMVGALLGGLSATVSFMAGDMFHAGQGALSAIASAGTGLTGMKQSGNMGANAGSLGIRVPYLIITRSASAMPAGFESMRGIPSTDLVYLGSMSGFTSVRDVHLEGIPATAEEINEIKELLSEGVIL